MRRRRSARPCRSCRKAHNYSLTRGKITEVTDESLNFGDWTDLSARPRRDRIKSRPSLQHDPRFWEIHQGGCEHLGGAVPAPGGHVAVRAGGGQQISDVISISAYVLGRVDDK